MTSIAESVSTTSSASNIQVPGTATLQPRLPRAERSDVVGHSGGVTKGHHFAPHKIQPRAQPRESRSDGRCSVARGQY